MLVAQSFMLAVSALLTVCAYYGIVTPWLLLIFTFLLGCGTALNTRLASLGRRHGSARTTCRLQSR